MADPDHDPPHEHVGIHYRGAAGAEYLDYQKPIGALVAKFDLWKFEGQVRPSDFLVDFGCGTGDLLEALTARVKVGIEVNEHARSIARDRGLETLTSARELEAESADVVISNHALEHTLCPLDEVRGLLRVLKRGGKLVLWLPLDDWRNQRTVRPDPNHHLYAWTPQLLNNLLLEAEFQVQECRVVTHAWPPFSEQLVRLPGRSFDMLATTWSVLRRRRQVMAVALRP